MSVNTRVLVPVLIAPTAAIASPSTINALFQYIPEYSPSRTASEEYVLPGPSLSQILHPNIAGFQVCTEFQKTVDYPALTLQSPHLKKANNCIFIPPARFTIIFRYLMSHSY